MLLPMLKMFTKNTYDKFAFFTAVMQTDTIAPQVGETTFEQYIENEIERYNVNEYR